MQLRKGTYINFVLHEGTEHEMNVTIMESLYPELFLVITQPYMQPAKVPTEMRLQDIRTMYGENVTKEITITF